MAVTYTSAGTVVTSSGVNPVLNPVGPGSSGADTREYLIITWKDGTIAEPVVGSASGTWVRVTSSLASGVVTGADVGSPNIALYVCDQTVPATNTVTFTGTVGQCQAVIVMFTKSALEFWEHNYTTGSDTTSGANVSAACGVLTSDTDFSSIVFAVVATNSDAGTPSAAAITDCTGVTNVINNASATGDDGRLEFWTATATTSSAARTFSYTNASTSMASVILVDLQINKLARVTGGTTVAGSGSSVALTPGSVTSGTGYRTYLQCAWKAATLLSEPVVTTTVGTWTRVTGTSNTTFVASGADTGSMRSELWYADGTHPTGTTITFTGTVGAAISSIFGVQSTNPTDYVIGHTYTTGEDDSHGANYSATGLVDLGLVEDDLVFAFTAINTDGASPSSKTITAASASIAVARNPTSQGDATGDDSGIYTSMAQVLGPIAATAGPAHTFTTGGVSNKGVTIFVKLSALPVPTFTVDPKNNFYENPAYTVTVEGLTDYDEFEVVRNDEFGDVDQDVRGLQRQDVTVDSMSTDDYEFAFGSTDWHKAANELTYTMNAYFNSELVHTESVDGLFGITSYTDAIDDLGGYPDGVFAKSFLSIPETPALNVPCVIYEFSEESNEGNILSSSHVLGRRMPVVNVDVMSGRKGSFSILVAPDVEVASYGAPDDADGYLDIFALGQICMLRNVSPFAVGFNDFYFVCTGTKVKRLGRRADMASIVAQSRIDGGADLPNYLYPALVIDVDWIEVDSPPNTVSVSQFTWQTLIDNFSSWQDVYDTFPDWLTVLTATDGDF